MVVEKVGLGGNTAATGGVKAGYRILEIEGTSTNGVDKAAAIDMIKQACGANGECTLKFLKVQIGCFLGGGKSLSGPTSLEVTV